MMVVEDVIYIVPRTIRIIFKVIDLLPFMNVELTKFAALNRSQMEFRSQLNSGEFMPMSKWFGAKKRLSVEMFFFFKLKIGDKMWQVQKPSLKPFCNNESLPIHLFKKWHQDWLVSLTLGEFWLEKRAVQHIDASTRIGASEYANRDGKGQPKDIDFSDPIHHCLGFNTLILRLWKVFLV